MITVVANRRSVTGRELSRVLWEPDPLPRGVVNWTGARLAPETALPVLNSESRTDKLGQLIALELAGVKVVPYSHTFKDGWLPRRALHQQGRDFTNPPLVADFWVKRLYLEDEWRLHFFKTAKGNVKLLRSGLKVPKTLRAHPWVKSHRLGWKLSYLGGAPQALVEEGRKAISALKLDFGAVDCALTFSRQPLVLEVNTCPGLEGPTLARYAEQIYERLEK